jgi:hypothetical protein
MTPVLKTLATIGVLAGSVAMVAWLFGWPHLSITVFKVMMGFCVSSLLVYLPFGLFSDESTGCAEPTTVVSETGAVWHGGNSGATRPVQPIESLRNQYGRRSISSPSP